MGTERDVERPRDLGGRKGPRDGEGTGRGREGPIRD